MKKRLLLGLILLIFTLLILISCEESTAVNTPQENENSEYSSSEACEHAFSEWEEIKKPSCTQGGKKTRTCSKCELIDTEHLEKLPHNAKISETVKPTCTKEGYSIYLCECGYTYKSDYTAPSGHTLTVEKKVAKTCSEVGYTHYNCEYCEYNFDSDFVPQSHEFEISITRPTATQSGFTTHTCSECSYHYDNDFIKYKDILPTPYLESSEPLCKGLDIYDDEHKTLNGEYLPLDWESIKAQGYDFVILKVGTSLIFETTFLF